VPSGASFATWPRILLTTFDCGPGIQLLPIQALPLGVELQPARRFQPTTPKVQHEREIRGLVCEIGGKRRGAERTVFRLRISLIEQREQLFRMHPGLARNPRYRLQRVRRGFAALGRGGAEEPRPPVAAGGRGGIGDERRESIEGRQGGAPPAVQPSTIVWPQLPVRRSTKFGTFIAAILSPSGLPEIDSPWINRAAVNAEATVVNSSIVTLLGGLLPITESSAMAGLLPLPLRAAGSPPLATRYEIASGLLGLSKLNVNRPSSPVWACPNCRGASVLADHRVTVDLANGACPTSTWPSICAANAGMLHNTLSATNTPAKEKKLASCQSSKLSFRSHTSRRYRQKSLTSENDGELAAQLPVRAGRVRVDGVVVGADLEIDRQFVEQLDDAADPAADRDDPLLARGSQPGALRRLAMTRLGFTPAGRRSRWKTRKKRLRQSCHCEVPQATKQSPP
jgi:hypothetical protein